MELCEKQADCKRDERNIQRMLANRRLVMMLLLHGCFKLPASEDGLSILLDICNLFCCQNIRLSFLSGMTEMLFKIRILIGIGNQSH